MEPLEFSEDFDTYALQRLKEILHALAPRGFVESPLILSACKLLITKICRTRQENVPG